MLFTIQLIELIFMQNFRYKILIFKFLIDDIVIDVWSSCNFLSIKDIIRECNPIVRFLKFISNKKIYKEFKKFLSKLVFNGEE